VLPADMRSALRWISSLNGSGPIARLPFELSVR
jgi:hypothetical protein